MSIKIYYYYFNNLSTVPFHMPLRYFRYKHDDRNQNRMHFLNEELAVKIKSKIQSENYPKI